MAHFAMKNPIWERKDLYYPTVGENLDILKQDQLIKSDPVDNKRRRTIVIKRQQNGKNLPSFGFTLQSYGLLDRKTYNSHLLSYVDYVELDGPAHIAGLRQGDVILSVNGVSMENADHQTLVECIKNARQTLRLIVLFEDCSRKIDLHMRHIRLQHVLAEKIRQLQELEVQEAHLLSGLSISNTPVNGGSDSENSMLSFYSADHLYSPDSEVFRAGSASLLVPTGFANASFHSLDSRVPSTAQKLFSFPSHDNISTVSDDVFSHGAPMCAPSAQYECNSLPISLMKKKKQRQRSQTSDVLNVKATSSEINNSSERLRSPSVTSAAVPKDETTGNWLSVPNQLEVRRFATKVTSPSSLRVSQLRNSFQRRVSADFRSFSRRVHRQITNHVLTEDTVGELPQLISLKRLCNDFRTSCLQQGLEQRRKSMDWMTTSVSESNGGDDTGSQIGSVDISASKNEGWLKSTSGAPSAADDTLTAVSPMHSEVNHISSEDYEYVGIEQTYRDGNLCCVNKEDECTRL